MAQLNKVESQKIMVKLDTTELIKSHCKRQHIACLEMENNRDFRKVILGIRKGSDEKRREYCDEGLNLAVTDYVSGDYSAAIMKVASVELVLQKEDHIQFRTTCYTLCLIHHALGENSAALMNCYQMEDTTDHSARSIALNSEYNKIVDMLEKRIEISESEHQQLQQSMTNKKNWDAKREMNGDEIAFVLHECNKPKNQKKDKKKAKNKNTKKWNGNNKRKKKNKKRHGN